MKCSVKSEILEYDKDVIIFTNYYEESLQTLKFLTGIGSDGR